MGESEPKSTHDTTDWQAMDIYVFSNGQMYSPPRKYHLAAEDLNYWEGTLQVLASHSSIRLYSIRGEKVETPLELSNGTAYVAVVPPDPFIHSGYEKYLIKATRSWEKRQENQIEVTKRKTGKVSTDAFAANSKNKRPSHIAKSQTSPKSLSFHPGRLTIGKQNVNNKIPIASSKPVIGTMRSRSPNMTNSVSKRTPLDKRKEVSPKKNIKPEIKTPVNLSQQRPLEDHKLLSVKNEKLTDSTNGLEIPINDIVPIVEFKAVSSISSSLTVVNKTNEDTLKNVPKEDSVTRTDTLSIPILFANPENDIASTKIEPSTFDYDEKGRGINPQNISSVTIGTNTDIPVKKDENFLELNREEFKSLVQSVIEEVSIWNLENRNTDNVSLKAISKSNLVNKKISESSSPENILVSQFLDEQFVAQLNNGDVINLKLDIEVINSNEIDASDHIIKTIRERPKSISKHVTEDKGVQVDSYVNKKDNIDNFHIDHKEIPREESNSQYKVEDSDCQGEVLNSNIVILACTCCNYNVKPENILRSCLNPNKKYLLLVTSDSFNKICESCDCIRDSIAEERRNIISGENSALNKSCLRCENIVPNEEKKRDDAKYKRRVTITDDVFVNSDNIIDSIKSEVPDTAPFSLINEKRDERNAHEIEETITEESGIKRRTSIDFDKTNQHLLFSDDVIESGFPITKTDNLEAVKIVADATTEISLCNTIVSIVF